MNNGSKNNHQGSQDDYDIKIIRKQKKKQQEE